VILEEAGGTFTDWRGNSSYQAGEGVATNGLLLEETLAKLAGT
jgi:histidinol-phosphatase